MENVSIFWFRRDLRLEDNVGLYHALKGKHRVLPVFIFDKEILQNVEKPFNRQVVFIHSRIQELKNELEKLNSSLLVSHNIASGFFEEIVGQYHVSAVYANEDYEWSAIERDNQIEHFLKTKAIPFHNFKDQVIFSKADILKEDGTPYTVFTPYSRKWKENLSEENLNPYSCKPYYKNLFPLETSPTPSLSTLGFEEMKLIFPTKEIDTALIHDYAETRDYPSADATSRLGVHLRFGTISIREVIRVCQPLSKIFLNELIWREFYQSIVYHFPHVCKGLSFKKQYDDMQWRNDEEGFECWCKGQTGYPIVDAGMRQLNETGFMHNRVRMITASFLVKHLLVDWRWGELYFQQQLLDFDFAANNGNWQWVAGCGSDAVPYFRIFNPELQTKRFDPDNEYIRRWIPGFSSNKYIKPIIDLEFARKRVLAEYKKEHKEF